MPRLVPARPLRSRDQAREALQLPPFDLSEWGFFVIIAIRRRALPRTGFDSHAAVTKGRRISPCRIVPSAYTPRGSETAGRERPEETPHMSKTATAGRRWPHFARTSALAQGPHAGPHETQATPPLCHADGALSLQNRKRPVASPCRKVRALFAFPCDAVRCTPCGRLRSCFALFYGSIEF